MSKSSKTVFIGFIILITAVSYLRGLGFYNDDWGFLSRLTNSIDKTIPGLFRANYDFPDSKMRPGQFFYQALLFRFFGEKPLYYHIANTLMLATASVLLALALCKIGLRPVLAYSVALFWGTLPHASTIRFWFASFQVPISFIFLFAAVLTEMHALDKEKPLRWWIPAIVFFIASGLMYEIALPFFLLIPVIVIYWMKRHGLPWNKQSLHLLLYPIGFAGFVFMKLMTTTRMHVPPVGAYAQWLISRASQILLSPKRADGDGFPMMETFRISFVDLGIRLPYHAFKSLAVLGFNVTLLPVIVAGTCAFFLLKKVQKDNSMAASEGGKLILIGLVLFCIGWAVFLGNPVVDLVPIGAGNRTAAAAMIGVAFVFTGLLEVIASIVPERHRQMVFAGAVSVVVMISCLYILRISIDWQVAWQKEQETLARIQHRFPNGFGGRCLILDGFQQNQGTAVILESRGDLSWALQTLYRDPDVQAEVLTPTVKISEVDIRTVEFDEKGVYPYGYFFLFRPFENIVSEPANQKDMQQYMERWHNKSSTQ